MPPATGCSPYRRCRWARTPEWRSRGWSPGRTASMTWLLRHVGMGRVFANAYAPSTLGSILRAYTFGHVRQLDAVTSRFLSNLARHAPLPAAASGTDVRGDGRHRRHHSRGPRPHKQGSDYGDSGAAAATPCSRPSPAPSRLRWSWHNVSAKARAHHAVRASARRRLEGGGFDVTSQTAGAGRLRFYGSATVGDANS